MSKKVAELYITAPTILKRSLTNAASLPSNQKYQIKESYFPMPIPVAAHRLEGGHVVFTTVEGSEVNGKNTWYVYSEHCRLVETVVCYPEAKDTVTGILKPLEQGSALKVPGLSMPIYLNTPIGRSKSFFWYEALRGGERVPESAAVTAGIIRLAEALQPFRDKIGKEFNITSWYRDYEANKACGGAVESRHLVGDAVDFWIDGMSKYEMYDLFVKIWGDVGGVGTYSNKEIVHLDARGYPCTWQY